MAFWRRLLAGSDWSHLLSVLSPSFFDVVSARDLSVRAAELARNWFDRDGYLANIGRMDAILGATPIGVAIASSKAPRSVVPFRAEPLSPGECSHRFDGRAVLRFFFLQIARVDTVFLDLRATRFCPSEDGRDVKFVPAPLWARWQPDFVEGIRQLYEGFYMDQPEQFERATRELGVSAANDVFIRAFGGQNKRSSQYSVAAFRDTFHEVFVRCRDSKTAFHPDFVTLGIMLATLYDHLEEIGGVYDVQAAYFAVRESMSKVGTEPK
ncbi:MAG TPA: hypothetical protein VIV60_01595 [Polyangiaceae bacterium]